MKKISTGIPDVYLIEPDIFSDERGYFFESFNDQKFKDLGIKVHFIQDNQSLSAKNVLRGLHFQCPPYAQGKLVRVIKGAVLDVAVDLRKNSTTYGKHVSYVLDESNKLMMWIPEGFAHGFIALEESTIFAYKCSSLYNKNAEGIIKWNDELLKIDWMTRNPIVSDRDLKGQNFKNFISPFT